MKKLAVVAFLAIAAIKVAAGFAGGAAAAESIGNSMNARAAAIEAAAR